MESGDWEVGACAEEAEAAEANHALDDGGGELGSEREAGAGADVFELLPGCHCARLIAGALGGGHAVLDWFCDAQERTSPRCLIRAPQVKRKRRQSQHNCGRSYGAPPWQPAPYMHVLEDPFYA